MNDLLVLDAGGGLAVHGAASVQGAARVREELVAAGVPERLTAKDPTLWGEEAEAEAKIRLGWVDTFRRSRDLLAELMELKEELGDLDHVVLAGMGGSSLAAEVVARTLDRPLTVLDTTDPHRVRAALGDRLDRTVVVVSSKSGSTVETDSHRRAYWQAFLDAGLSEPEAGRRFVVVTDAGSPLEETARRMGAYVILADPDVGGRYSALTAFGLVPSALIGVDVAELLDEAEAFSATLGADTDNPALALGAALAAAATTEVAGRHGPPVGAAERSPRSSGPNQEVDEAGPGWVRDKLALVEDGTGIVGLGDWVEQLVAESTGKQGKGILPLVLENPGAPGSSGPDVLTVTVGGALPPRTVPGGGVRPHVAVNGSLGAQFLAWEYATAVAGRVLGINPFDQPNVAESKDNTSRILSSGAPPKIEPSFVEGDVRVYGPPAATLEEALGMFLADIDPRGYLAVTAYLDRVGDVAAAALREALAGAIDRPVTFGWGPRYLHSTGQYHKGGPQHGSFLQITGAVAEDLPVPGQPYTFGQLQAAQAAGDRQALASRGRPVLWLHLTDRAAGLADLLGAARALGG